MPLKRASTAICAKNFIFFFKNLLTNHSMSDMICLSVERHTNKKIKKEDKKMKIYRVTSDTRLQSSENTKDAFYNEYFGDYTPQIERFFTDLDEAKAFYDSIKIGEAGKRSGTITVYTYEAKMLESTDADDDSDEETLEDLYNTGLCTDVMSFDCSDPYHDSEPDEDDDDDDEQD